jgi:hypothetical protein
LAEKLMKKPAPKYNEFIARVQKEKLQNDNSGYPSLFAWRYMAELTYSGNGSWAKRFAYLVNSDDIANDKKPFWTDGKFYWVKFLNMLAESQHWHDLGAINGFEEDQYADLPCPY